MDLASASAINEAPRLRPAATPAISVAQLTVSHFRCHGRLSLDIPPEPVVLTGVNGAGKTSLLEALSLLAPGRGLRRARASELVQRGADGTPAAGWSVSCRVRGAAGPSDVLIGWRDGDASAGRDRRLLHIDGQAARSRQALASLLSLVWLTPEMDRLFLEGASGRRRFLDRLVFGDDPAHAGRLAAYERTLQQRAVLLRQGKADPVWLAALEDGLATGGVAIAAARRAFSDRLSSTALGRGGPFPSPHLAMAGTLDDWLDQGPALAAEDRLRAALAACRRQDADTGGASIGPHRSDLIVRHAGSGRPAAQCSTSEQKTLLIAIVLAAAALQAQERGAAPVLLLDEVAAHLDWRHRSSLFDAVADLGAQAWYAGTDTAVFAPLVGRAHFITVGEPAGSGERYPLAVRADRSGLAAYETNEGQEGGR